MRKVPVLGVVLAITGLAVLAACVPFPFGGPPPRQQPYPYGPGGGTGPGMMGGGMMGPGMMGGGRGYSPSPDAKPITIDRAADAARGYLSGYYGGRLTLTEVMDFAWNYYAEVEEKDTGIHAMELLIDKYTGRVYPEMGPNMMWNIRYGMMGGRGPATAEMPVSPEQARKIAQDYLDTNLPGLTVDEVDTFYGYYTLHTEKRGEVEGMLSVNGYTGAVWYHTWHGPFIGMKEYDNH